MQDVNQSNPGWIRKSINKHIMVGVSLILLLNCGVAGWAATTEIAGALISPGMIVSASHVKKVQHPTGGVVSRILVHNDSRVKTGDLLIKLDDTVIRSNLAIVTKGLDQLRGRKARLQAERDRLAAIEFPPELTSRNGEERVRQLLSEERQLFTIRQTVREGQRRQLKERISQLNEEISGLEAQRTAKNEEGALIDKETQGVRQLWDLKLVEANRINTLERDATRTRGEHAQLSASISAARGKIAEIELQIIQIDQDLASEVAGEMREIDAKIGELEERQIAEEDQLKRIDIRAPQDGYVHELAVYTIGGVVAPGDVLMQIVPNDDLLAVEARVRPQDIDQMHLDQNATLRFSAFSQRTTPEIRGVVDSISPDVSTDRRTGASYYSVRIAIASTEVARLGNVALVPGMPVEAFIQTGERSVASYLVKPFYDQIMRAFRET
ncbi:MAG: HlyD family type I secretion periplasmic adaptor subunit [Allorhizobium sp.]